MKHKLKNKIESGFTVIELLVVISIMVLLSGAVIIGFNRQRASRSVVLAQNETVTNIRKVQSYTLSSRNINATTPVKFYVLRFGTGDTSYTVNGIDSTYTYYPNLETVNLPDGATISHLELTASSDETGDREGAAELGEIDQIQGDIDIAQEDDLDDITCVQIAFAAPYGQMYLDSTGDCTTGITTDLRDPATLLTKANQILTITINNPRADSTKTIILHGLSGRVTGN